MKSLLRFGDFKEPRIVDSWPSSAPQAGPGFPAGVNAQRNIRAWTVKEIAAGSRAAP